ncbi:GHKL domain-containing protein [Streptococcus gallolyticus]|nr:GHKL domain-containing protein [Streptococcus gallolyticus]MBY5041199.1 GHKL domain-containing protein [Streptococcus gallolyticus]
MFLIEPGIDRNLIVFSALFPYTFYSLVSQIFYLFLIPAVYLSEQVYLDSGGVSILVSLLSTVFLLSFLHWGGYDFSLVSSVLKEEKQNKLLLRMNLSMIAYYMLDQHLLYVSYKYNRDTTIHSQLVVVAYLLIFMFFVNQLDRTYRERIQEQLSFQKKIQMDQLHVYTQQIETLYKEVRGFRHDYSNILRTLKLGIVEKNIAIIEDVFDRVLKDSNKPFQESKFEVGRLVNIQENAFKSLLASKFMQAREHGVEISLEIPREIQPRGMELIDFILVVASFLDNAIEEAALTEEKKISFAFFQQGQQQVVAIENSCQMESKPIAELYKYGKSSKGQGRGIGLVNVKTILEKYPQVFLRTTSEDFQFCQTVVIHLEN